MELTLQLVFNILLAVCTYLLGMAFAGSFLGRRWMGTVDVFLHRVLKLDVTIGKYLYWKHFCNIPSTQAQEHGETHGPGGDAVRQVPGVAALIGT